MVAPQAAPITNPFGTLPAMPQMSIGRTGTSPSIQYGISSLPVVEKPVPVRISSLLTSRHLSQRRIRLPVRKYHPKADGPKVPFFNDDEETPSTPKADALFVPRENPRALVIRPLEQWPSRSSAEKTKAPSSIHENGKVRQDVYNSINGHGSKDKDEKGDSYITLTGHRAGEAAIVYEHGADIEALMPKLRHSDYFTEPRIQELAAKERAEPGFCRHVKDFVVGRHGYGSIKFFGETDVRRLDLESLIQFNNREVIVYMDESKKPPVGQGLNKPAEVTLLNIKCFDKKTGQQYTEGPRIEKYKEMLKRKAEDQGAEFVSYDPVKGEWKFRVNHFSKYKLGDENETDEIQLGSLS
ncbi:UNVERIFIED_CONTAM: Nuclear pore complex protein A [Sesamum radiatum]|uniref:Nuclear pore complex protein A n=1 Tax=Sesamum radiatum TaxID=300843 RepID=A0AAW2JP77_SESRA